MITMKGKFYIKRIQHVLKNFCLHFSKKKKMKTIRLYFEMHFDQEFQVDTRTMEHKCLLFIHKYCSESENKTSKMHRFFLDNFVLKEFRSYIISFFSIEIYFWNDVYKTFLYVEDRKESSTINHIFYWFHFNFIHLFSYF